MLFCQAGCANSLISYDVEYPFLYLLTNFLLRAANSSPLYIFFCLVVYFLCIHCRNFSMYILNTSSLVWLYVLQIFHQLFLVYLFTLFMSFTHKEVYGFNGVQICQSLNI